MTRKDRRVLKGIVEKVIRQLVGEKDETGMINLSHTNLHKYSTIITKTLIKYQYKSSIDFFDTIYMILGEINDLHETIIPIYKNVEIQRLSEDYLGVIIKKG